MKFLIIATAAFETAVGLALLVLPSVPVSLLLGSALDRPVELVIARVAGAAILALGVACWLARDDGSSRAAGGLLAALLLYNTAAAVVLAHAGIRWELSGIGLWPSIGLHLVLAVWCIACIRSPNRR